MKREFRFARFFTPLLCALLLGGATLFTGCTNSLLTAQEEDHTPALQSCTFETGTTSKLHHAHLMDRARRTTAGKGESGSTVGLAISMDETAFGADKLFRHTDRPVWVGDF